MKRFLVSGASRGIGRSVAELAVARGAAVVVNGRDEVALGQVCAAATGAGSVVSCPGDLTSKEDRERLVAASGALDYVVLCAGVAQHESIQDLREETMRSTFEVNFFAQALLARDLVSKVREGGSFTFVSSTLASRAAKNTAAYAASKAALEAWVRTMALELAPAVRVNAVAPGLVETDMARHLRLLPGEAMPAGEELKKRQAKQIQEMDALHPLGRVGQPEEVAELILQVSQSPWMTGSIVTHDGGLSLA